MRLCGSSHYPVSADAGRATDSASTRIVDTRMVSDMRPGELVPPICPSGAGAIARPAHQSVLRQTWRPSVSIPCTTRHSAFDITSPATVR
jgi:hypothetical protein